MVPFTLSPAILFRKCKKLTLADDGGKDHSFFISEIELRANTESPRRLADKPEEHPGIEQKTLRHEINQSS